MAGARTESLKQRLLNSKNSICMERARLLTESMRETEGQPMLLRQAKALAHILENITVNILPDELIVGTMTSRPPGAILYPEGAGLLMLSEFDAIRERPVNPFQISDGELALLKEEVFPYWEKRTLGAYASNYFPAQTDLIAGKFAFFILTELAGISHATINYPYLLSVGFEDIAEMAVKKIEEHDSGDKEDPAALSKCTFYKAAKLVSEAMIRFGRRYSEKARALAMSEADERRRDELLLLAQICDRVPAKPPRTFYEALQFIWFTQIALHQENYEQGISLGRMDQYLLPLYQKDLREGNLDYEQAVELVQCLWIKTSELVPLFSSAVTTFFGGLPTNQAVSVGGIDRAGENATNELSHLLLDATHRIRVRQPNFHVRFHRHTPVEFRDKVSEVMKAGGGILALVNDEVIVPTLVHRGVSLEDARDYAITGCVEPTSAGRTFGSTDAALFNLAICLELALTNGKSRILQEETGVRSGDPLKFTSMDELVEAFRKQVAYFVKHMVVGCNCLGIVHREIKPTPLLSLCIQGCFERGKDITLGSAKYNFTGMQAVGIADVADSLAAIDKLVFGEKAITMEELLRALEGNFEGEERLRQMLLYRASKYGIDDDSVDRYAQVATRIYNDEVERYTNTRGGRFSPGIYPMNTHNGFGLFIGALPSGRLAQTSLVDGVSPGHGNDVKGPTAAMKSVAKIDHHLFANGISYNMKFTPRALGGEGGTRGLSALIKTYFDLGGMHVQFNVVDRETLLDAQRNPEKHRDLLVRIAGFSAHFTELSKEVQDEIIERTEHCSV